MNGTFYNKELFSRLSSMHFLEINRWKFLCYITMEHRMRSVYVVHAYSRERRIPRVAKGNKLTRHSPLTSYVHFHRNRAEGSVYYYTFNDGTINPPGCIHCHTMTLHNCFVTACNQVNVKRHPYRKQDIIWSRVGLYNFH